MSEPDELALDQAYDSPANRPVLSKGDKGSDVRIVQALLLLKQTGKFDKQAEAAVKGFQRGVGVVADGIVGPMTWAELDGLEQVPIDVGWHRRMLAAVMVPDQWPEEFGVAFKGVLDDTHEQIEVVNDDNGHHVICGIVTGDVPEGADVGVTQAAANEIGLDLTGRVSWAYTEELDEGEQ